MIESRYSATNFFPLQNATVVLDAIRKKSTKVFPRILHSYYSYKLFSETKLELQFEVKLEMNVS